MSLRLAVLASGRGSNLRTILEHISSGRLRAEVCLALSNNPEAGALAHATEFGVPCWAKSHTEFANRAEFDAAMLAEIKKAGAEAVVLAGYMRLISPEFLQAFPGRVLNIHPALLPSFPGLHGGRDAVDYGVRISGCTVHFVEEDMDRGPIIIQAAVPLLAHEEESDLMGRIHALEHRIYPQAIQWLAEGRLRSEGRAVHLLPPAADKTVRTVEEKGCLISPPMEDF